MDWQWTKITCWLLSFALLCETGDGISFGVAGPVSELPVSSQEEEEGVKPQTELVSLPAGRRTAASRRRARFLPSSGQAIHEQAVVSLSQSLCERTRHKGAGTHLRC
jgi:hypothetical protein